MVAAVSSASGSGGEAALHASTGVRSVIVLPLAGSNPFTTWFGARFATTVNCCPALQAEYRFVVSTVRTRQ